MMSQHENIRLYFYLALIDYKIVCLCVYVYMLLAILAAQLALREIIN